MQHSKETYVLFGCAYCHGLDLMPRGEAADLRRSALVGGDENANLIGPLLRAGIPQTAKLSPMPQFSDLSDQQIAAIARWIHYARQRAQYDELTSAPMQAGAAATGREQFDRSVRRLPFHPEGSCRYRRPLRRRRAARANPRSGGAPQASSFRVDRLRDARLNAGRDRHRALLESYSAAEVANLATYLQSSR